MTRLLVSVRSALEAEIALNGGAALIDVKEPRNGPLGMASLGTIAEVVQCVASRVPVSAALGEARDAADFLPEEIARRLAYVKYGASHCQAEARRLWEFTCWDAARQLAAMGSTCQVVAVAYADWQRARAPCPKEICTFACDHGRGALLLDTWGKDGSTLLDWLSPIQIAELCKHCQAARLPIALAGSLRPRQIRELLPIRPDWIAVRGAACSYGRRESSLELSKVRALAELVRNGVSIPAD